MRARLLPAGIAIALVAFAAPAADQVETLADAQGRIQYAVYTRDAGALRATRADLRTLVGDGNVAPLAFYYLGHVDFRLAQLALHEEEAEANGHLDDCIEHADAALERDPELAEAHALSAACHGLQADFSPIAGVLASRSAASHLREARELAPDNPRIELLAAMELYRHAAEGDPQVAAGFERALQLFAREDGPRAGWPDWGLAEAHAYLGSVYLANGDIMRARNELERALLIAPDYAWVLELVSSIQTPLE